MTYPAAALCDLAADWLAARHADALIVRELSVGKWGSALIDIAAILPDRIVGIEIKGVGDSPARLERQGWVYSRVASQMFLLTTPSLDSAGEKHLPNGWWPLRVVDGQIASNKGTLVLDEEKWGRVYGPDQLPNAPAQLLECLITRELRSVGRRLTPGHDIGKTVPSMIATISEHAPLCAIRCAVAETLRARDWLAYDRSTGRDRSARYRWADGRALKGVVA